MSECAFCGQDQKLRREHVWPDWLVREVPADDLRHRRLRALFTVGASPDRLEIRDEGPAAAPERVKVVCQTECNGGWMSRLESAVKPVMLPLIHDQRTHLSDADQRLLAFWTAKTMMMVEYTDPGSRTTTVAQRRFLYEHREDKTLPPQFWVWVGRYDPEGEPLVRFYFHTSAAGVPLPGKKSPDAASLAAMNVAPNIEQTTFLIGHLLLVIFSNSVGAGDLASDMLGVNFYRIWPTAYATDWPLTNPLNAWSAIDRENPASIANVLATRRRRVRVDGD